MTSDAHSPDPDQLPTNELRLIENRSTTTWDLQFLTLDWMQAHEPDTEWKTIHTWNDRPPEEMLNEKITKTLQNPRYFNRCQFCKRVRNIGHLDTHQGDPICHTCQEEHFIMFH